VNAKQKTTAANVNFLTNIIPPCFYAAVRRGFVVRRENGDQLLQAYGGKVTIV
jgi:hypothetical protein